MDNLLMHPSARNTQRIGATTVIDEPEAAAPPPSPRKGNLLFVDPDDFLLELLENGLALSRPAWRIVAVHDVAEAIAVLEENAELDAIVTEIVFGRTAEEGKAFVRQVTRRWPEIPLFILTSAAAEETRGLDAAEHIAKPPDIDFLAGRIDRALRRQRESLVRGIPLPTFLQILALERNTCTLVVSERGRAGEIWLRDGALLDARIDGLEGRDALFAMLSMRGQSVRVLDRCDAEPRMAANLTSLLMEWSVREDHAARATEENG